MASEHGKVFRRFPMEDNFGQKQVELSLSK